MSANRIFLVCKHCQSIEDSLLIAERESADDQYMLGKMKRADDWFAKHQRCSRDPDNFQLAYHRPLNWDVALPAENTVAGGVRLGIATQ